MSPEELADALSVSRAYIRVILDSGAPQSNGKAQLNEIVDWALNHNAEIRALAGLPELPPVPSSASPQEAAEFKVRYHVVTMLEFQAARTSDHAMKDAMFKQVEKIKTVDFTERE